VGVENEIEMEREVEQDCGSGSESGLNSRVRAR
jgi:hypothetical protein